MKGHQPAMDAPAMIAGEESKMKGKHKSMHRVKRGTKRTKKRGSGKRY